MGNKVCTPKICRPIGKGISPCCVIPNEEEAHKAIFPFNAGLYLKSYSVYVPFWDGATSIYALQLMPYSYVPLHAFPQGVDLPGVTIPPEEIPIQFYTSSNTPYYACSYRPEDYEKPYVTPPEDIFRHQDEEELAGDYRHETESSEDLNEPEPIKT